MNVCYHFNSASRVNKQTFEVFLDAWKDDKCGRSELWKLLIENIVYFFPKIIIIIICCKR